MPSLFQGPIANEYSEIAGVIRAHDEKDPEKKKSTGDSCGSNCTTPFDCSKAKESQDSCPAIPGREEKYQAFAPAVAGWSEPPAPAV